MGTTANLKLPWPELTDAVDGPGSFDALAQGVEDYFYRRILPAGITRYPVYHWGSGTVYPLTPAVGDTFTRLDLGPSVMRWNGGGWRQIEPAELPNYAAIAALPTALLYGGFQAVDTSTQILYRWSGTGWAAVTLDSSWVRTMASDGAYLVGVNATAQTLPGALATVTVPIGRQLDVEFHALGHANGGFVHARLYINGAQVDACTVGASADVYTPIVLTGSYLGTGANIEYHVTGELQGGLGSGDVRGTPNAPYGVTMRHRIS